MRFSQQVPMQHFQQAPMQHFQQVPMQHVQQMPTQHFSEEASSDDESVDDYPSHGRRRKGALCAYGTYLCCYGCACCWCVFLALGAFTFALLRNYDCNSAALEGVPAPFNDELLPKQVQLRERIYTWQVQFTKLIDVYDMNDQHLGYFYDMNFLWFMRFGFSDKDDRIWFEAKRPWFYGASSIGEWWGRYRNHEEHYYLNRCDASGGSLGGTYYIDEDMSIRPWWCQMHCMKILDLTHVLKPNLPTPVARVHFNYTLEWYYGGFETRKGWNMLMEEPGTKMPDGSYVSSNKMIAFAQQHFALQQRALSWQGNFYISRWLVDVKVEEPGLPNWVIVFMAALDDIDEASHHSQGH